MVRIKVALVVGIAAAGLLAYDFSLGVIIWDGGFPLEIELVNKGKRKIIRVSADTLLAKEWAEELRVDPRQVELNLKPVAWAEGKSFTVDVPCSGRQSGFGRRLSYMQFPLLLLLVEYADGSNQYITAEIPDGRTCRKMVVEAP